MLDFKSKLNRRSRIVILTGAGISAESGIKTFRDSNGLWHDHRIEDVASPQGFTRNPKLVQDFYNQRRMQLHDVDVRPNAAHLALAELESQWSAEFLLVTQNVDNLHVRAGSKKLISMHGELMKARCQRTEKVYDWSQAIEDSSTCECCKKTGTLRPHIVWFGEMPLEMDRIEKHLSNCDLFISIGTSGLVYPAAGLVRQVPDNCITIDVNIRQEQDDGLFQQYRIGAASVTVPELVREILSAVR